MSKVLEQATVRLHHSLGPQTYLLRLEAPQIAKAARPGQFVNIKLLTPTQHLLRHPFGVAGVDTTEGTLDIIYRTVGEFTYHLTVLQPGNKIDVLGPLGHGFDIAAHNALLVGGGTGLAPLLFLAAELGAQKTDALMGGRTQGDLFWQNIYAPHTRQIFVTSDDGSVGTHGTVMAKLPSLLKENTYDCVYTCGPSPMMKAVAACCEEHKVKCQVSLERYMACGLGACLSCTCQGREKRLKVCTDGPVFWATEVSEW